jgi:hypothetical protein
MTTNKADWERGWFYLCNAEPGLPSFTGKVLQERAPEDHVWFEDWWMVASLCDE